MKYKVGDEALYGPIEQHVKIVAVNEGGFALPYFIVHKNGGLGIWVHPRELHPVKQATINEGEK